jgi:hypothetical protein
LTILSAPTPAPLDLVLLVERAIRLSAAKPTKAKFSMDIDILRLLVLG